MNRTNLGKQRAARRAIDGLFANPSSALVIHYSCESFYDRPGGASSRITSIAVRNLASGQTASFSIHQVAERHSHNLDNIDVKYDDFEREMLDDYFRFVDRHINYNWIHWNMRDINYGFAALEHRFRVLGGEPIVIPDDHKFDLARLLVDLYGSEYIGHSRLEQLVKKNDITYLAFMTGREEAKAFEEGNYVGLHQSTLRKVDVIANIIGRTHERTLMTNATWWEIHGSSIRGITDTLATHPLYVILAVVAALASIVGLVGLLR